MDEHLNHFFYSVFGGMGVYLAIISAMVKI